METRIDNGRIFKSERTDEGYLRVWMTVSKIGDLVYRNDDGSQRVEYVSKETLFDQSALDTAWGKPITLNHPDVGLLDSGNTAQYQRGMTQQGMVVNDGFLTVVGVVTDKEAIDEIKNGANQISAGYKANIVARGDGTFEQRNRRYNHFAIVKRGRAGDDVKVHLDCFRTDAVDDSDIGRELSPQGINNYQGLNMTKTIHLDGIGYQVEGDLAIAFVNEQKRYDSQITQLQETVATLEKEKTELQANLDTAQGALEANKTKLDEASNVDTLKAEISARMDAWSEVLPSLQEKDKDFRADYGQSVADIRRTFLTKVRGHKDLESRTDHYIDGLYEGLRPSDASDYSAKTLNHFDEFAMVGKKGKPKENDLTERRKNRPLPGVK